MAEVSQDSGGSHRNKPGKKRSKKQSTRIDFTPMVDLGFLLITFFMLTTTLSKPQTMEINMPVKDSLPEEEKTKIKASQAMTLILSNDNKVYYYFGIEDPKVLITDFSNTGVRKILLEKNRELNRQGVDSIPVYKSMFKTGKIKEDELKKHISRIKAFKDGLIVVIKADDKAKYKNLVDILDEMQICNIGRYAIVDITPTDKEFIKLAFPEYQI